MLSKVADTITGVFASLSVVFLCCLYLFCENIRKENGVTQLMCHNRFSDCCVALHPSAGISTEINEGLHEAFMTSNKQSHVM